MSKIKEIKVEVYPEADITENKMAEIAKQLEEDHSKKKNKKKNEKISPTKTK